MKGKRMIVKKRGSLLLETGLIKEIESFCCIDLNVLFCLAECYSWILAKKPVLNSFKCRVETFFVALFVSSSNA